ncbi:MAG TPA: enolase C-terminal domain-like protein, partial [Gemmataceae bacterium]|nr:enolase C-terminal domain-like protein [Gemmataceae bacterium]
HGYEGVLVGDEGGFGPRLDSNEQAIEMLLEAFVGAGLTPGHDAGVALDVAATHLVQEDGYSWQGKVVTSGELIATLKRWVDYYPVYSIEDGLAEDDWKGWRQLTSVLGSQVQLVGDDLFVTNPERLQRGLTAGVANSILIKVNQIGTLTETLRVMDMARAAGYRTIVSARSGETEDSLLADLAVGTGAGQIKIGGLARSERLAKYNQLLRIEEELPAPEQFAGWQPV